VGNAEPKTRAHAVALKDGLTTEGLSTQTELTLAGKPNRVGRPGLWSTAGRTRRQGMREAGVSAFSGGEA
jgi:hypothetical protein